MIIGGRRIYDYEVLDLKQVYKDAEIPDISHKYMRRLIDRSCDYLINETVNSELIFVDKSAVTFEFAHESSLMDKAKFINKILDKTSVLSGLVLDMINNKDLPNLTFPGMSKIKYLCVLESDEDDEVDLLEHQKFIQKLNTLLKLELDGKLLLIGKIISNEDMMLNHKKYLTQNGFDD